MSKGELVAEIKIIVNPQMQQPSLKIIRWIYLHDLNLVLKNVKLSSKWIIRININVIMKGSPILEELCALTNNTVTQEKTRNMFLKCCKDFILRL